MKVGAGDMKVGAGDLKVGAATSSVFNQMVDNGTAPAYLVLNQMVEHRRSDGR